MCMKIQLGVETYVGPKRVNVKTVEQVQFQLLAFNGIGTVAYCSIISGVVAPRHISLNTCHNHAGPVCGD